MNENQYQQYSFCSYCGTPYEDRKWPRKCAHCGNLTFHNPIPVVVGLLAVNSGILVIRRGIEPRKGWLALPGGYIEMGETWEAALARELFEETGLEVDDRVFKLVKVRSVHDGTIIICATTSDPLSVTLPPFTVTDETSDRVVINEPVELAFPLHTELVNSYFNGSLPIC